MTKRVILVILDGVGIGGAKDAKKYGDENSNTLLNVIEKTGIKLPNLTNLGILNLLYNMNIETLGSYGILEEESPGKDTTTGHWELMGVKLEKPFPVYPDGFPEEIIKEFEKRIGRKVLWNKPASGTEIIKKLGEEHIKTGYPIVYTSADSVFQIAAHVDVIPLSELYKMCEIAREILKGEHAVARVIARPFSGEIGKFYRTPDRKDYSLEPPIDTLLDILIKNGFKTLGIGKVYDIFAKRGFTEIIHIENNTENMAILLKKTIEEVNFSLIFTNLVDFDMNYGHRRDLWGFANALLEFDGFLGNYLKWLKDEDILIITADHGNDPTFLKHTDHTRENVPIIFYGKDIKKNNFIGIHKFSDLGATIGEIFGVKTHYGKSFLERIMV
ncbi:MAG: phosphopentomutase [Caldisericia bacterium]|nr:phosphopentomutase [Caldisericia bacterium]